ncbi:MAG: response regulator [Alphaproteobacteria bacterium]|nr:response regulator [Alphaproteobacteria bacterium]
MMGYRLDRLAVLIVDDNQHMRSLVRTILESLGVSQIMEARDGAHALEKMSQTQVDLLVADWNMEPMDGLDLTRHLRTSPESPDQFVPVIMLSGHTERARVMQARDAGVTEFMAKPVSARSLYARIVSIIENPRPFVRTNDYFGPDRRRQMLPFEGPDRRKAPGSDTAKPGQPLTGDQQAALKRTKDAIKSMQKS